MGQTENGLGRLGDMVPTVEVLASSRAGSATSAGHLCQGCRVRRARFSYRGVVKADRLHTLCFACFRNELERARARRLKGTPTDPLVYAEIELRRRHALLVARQALQMDDQPRWSRLRTAQFATAV
jgi:hypothetical protein